MGKRGSIDSALDRLFQAPLGEFTGVRDTLAAELKDQGQSAAAAQIKTTKKPSVSAWAVNQLFFREPEAWARLEEIGGRLQEEYGGRGSGGAEARHKLQDSLRRAIDALQKEARRVLEKEGPSASAATLNRIGATLHALALRPSRPQGSDEVRAGRLSTDVDPPGLEALLGGEPELALAPARPTERAPAGRPVRNKESVRKKEPAATRREGAASERERAAELRKERARKERARKAAHVALRAAEKELARSKRTVEAADRRVAAARAALSAAEEERTRAEAAERAAREEVEAARRRIPG